MDDANDLPNWLEQTELSKIELTHEVLLAQQIVKRIQENYQYCQERPRWRDWYDQVSRSSSSVLLNWMEAIGRARGYFLNSALIARGEAYETYASLTIGANEICEPIRPLVKLLIQKISQRITDQLELTNKK